MKQDDVFALISSHSGYADAYKIKDLLLSSDAG